MSDRLDERIHTMMRQVIQESPLPPVLPDRPVAAPRRITPNVAVAVASAASVLLIIGAASFLLGGANGGPQPLPPAEVTTTIHLDSSTSSLLVGSEATARAAGESYDFAIHDLCAWFSDDEVREIIADAHAIDPAVWEDMVGVAPTLGVGHDTANPRDFTAAGCEWWPEEIGAYLAIVLSPQHHFDPEWPHQHPDEFERHPALHHTARIGNLSGGNVWYIRGVQADISVEEHDVIGFTYLPADDSIDRRTINLVGPHIANRMLRAMNWLPD